MDEYGDPRSGAVHGYGSIFELVDKNVYEAGGAIGEYVRAKRLADLYTLDPDHHHWVINKQYDLSQAAIEPVRKAEAKGVCTFCEWEPAGPDGVCHSVSCRAALMIKRAGTGQPDEVPS